MSAQLGQSHFLTHAANLIKSLMAEVHSDGFSVTALFPEYALLLISSYYSILPAGFSIFILIIH